MTEKELKKLNRYQLLELIILQTEQIDTLRAELEQAKKALEEKQIRLSSAGSIAEAALQISGIFEAAQSAADIYLEQVRTQTQNVAQLEADARQKAESITADAQAQADLILSNAQAESLKLLENSKAESDRLLAAGREQYQKMIADANAEAERIRSGAEAVRIAAESMMAQTIRDCEEREQAVAASIQKIREAFQNQFVNLDSLT